MKYGPQTPGLVILMLQTAITPKFLTHDQIIWQVFLYLVPNSVKKKNA